MSQANGGAADNPTAREVAGKRRRAEALEYDLRIARAESLLKQLNAPRPEPRWLPVNHDSLYAQELAKLEHRQKRQPPRDTAQGKSPVTADFLEAQRELREWGESWDWLDLFHRSGFNDEQAGGYGSWFLSTANDRRYGHNWPFWRSWAQHSRLRQGGRVLFGQSQIASGIVENISSFVIGSGFTYRALPRKNTNPPAELVSKLQTFLDYRFLEPNSWPDVEKEHFRRCSRDGESLHRHFVHDGLTRVRIYEPEWLMDPPTMDQETNSYGIINDREDLFDIKGYWFALDGVTANGEEVPADEVSHFKVNVDRIIKRGMPDLSFDTYENLRRIRALLENMLEGGAIQAAIPFFRQHATASASQISDFIGTVRTSTRTNDVTGRTESFENFVPGTIPNIDGNQEIVTPPFASNVHFYVELLQAGYRGIAVKWAAPEWITSADSSNSNFASSLVAEAPFVKRCERSQSEHKAHFLRILWQAVKAWCEEKRMEAGGHVYTYQEVRSLVDIECTPPRVKARNQMEEAQANSVYVQLGVKSRQMVAAELAIDYEDVERDNAEYEESHGSPGLGLGDPGAMPAVASPDTDGRLDQPLGGTAEGDEVTTPGAEPTAESVLESHAQTLPYTCGPAALRAACAAFGIDRSENELAAMLGTSPEAGTPPQALVSGAQKLGLTTSARDNMRLADLARAGCPVLVCLQAFDEPSAGTDGGHWCVVTGCQDGEITLIDPATGGQRTVPAEDFIDRWHDRDAEGREYRRYGVVVSVAKGEPEEPAPVVEQVAEKPASTPAAAPITMQVPVVGMREVQEVRRNSWGLVEGVEKYFLPLVEVKDASGHEHAADGKFGTGGASGVSSDSDDSPAAKKYQAELAKWTERQAARDGRSSAADAATDIANAASFPFASRQISQEDFASDMKAAASEWSEQWAKAGEQLKAAGASGKEVSAINRATERAGKKIERLGAAYGKVFDKLNVAQAAADEVTNAEPPEPDDPEYPDEPQPPEGDDPAEQAKWEKAHDAYEAEVEKIDAAHEKTLEAWEAEHDRWEAESGKAQAKLDAATDKHDEVWDAYEAAYTEAGEEIGELVHEAANRMHDDISDEAEADEEPEEPEDIDESRRVAESGFTGTVTDTLGRERKYVDGKPVAVNAGEPAEKPPAADKPAAASQPSAKPSRGAATATHDDLTAIVAELDGESPDHDAIAAKAEQVLATNSQRIVDAVDGYIDGKFAEWQADHGEAIFTDDVADQFKSDVESSRDNLVGAMDGLHEAVAAGIEEHKADGELSDETKSDISTAAATLKAAIQQHAQTSAAAAKTARTQMQGNAERLNDEWEGDAGERAETLNGETYADDPEAAEDDAKLFNAELEKAGNPYRLTRGEDGQWTHLPPDIEESRQGSGFTGTKTDSLGRKNYYQDGVHVASPSAGQKAEIENAGKASKPASGKRTQEQEPSEKAARAKAAHKLVDKSIQRYAEEHNEPRFAKMVGGVSHPNSEPMDVTTKSGDLVELKTLVDNGNNKITMDSYSQIRKIAKEQETGKRFHTVVSDDRQVFKADGNHDETKDRVYYYRRGVAGSARIDGMHKCKDEAELKKLMATPEDQLPPAAQRTDAKHRVGKWKFFQDAQGKGYKNSKTGVVFRAKK